MTRVLFFIHNGWVFGKIHNELIKVLYPDLYCDILCWSHTYNATEMALIREKYDLIVSTPEACFFLHQHHAVPYEKLIAVAHQDWDIFNPIEKMGVPASEFNNLAGYAVICPLLVNISFSYGVGRVPHILPVGIFCEQYERAMSERVQRLGYFGRWDRRDRGDLDIKRGALVERVAKEAGMEFVKCDSVHFLAADRLYRDVDLVVFGSLIEGNPYVAIEAAAAGVPVLGTSTGLFPDIAKTGGGAVLPFEEDKFVAEAVEVIHALQADHNLYTQMSAAAKECSKGFDWSVLGPVWRDYFFTCLSQRNAV